MWQILTEEVDNVAGYAHTGDVSIEPTIPAWQTDAALRRAAWFCVSNIKSTEGGLFNAALMQGLSAKTASSNSANCNRRQIAAGNQ